MANHSDLTYYALFSECYATFSFFFFNHTRLEATLGVCVTCWLTTRNRQLPSGSTSIMWSLSRSIATLNSASAIIASSSSLLVRVVLLLVTVELLPDPEPAWLLLLLSHTLSPIEWELWRAPSMLWLMPLPPPWWPTSNFDAPYGVFFTEIYQIVERGREMEKGKKRRGIKGARHISGCVN